MTTTHDAYHTAVAADNAWQAELTRLFGKRAGDVRYTLQGKGQPGSDLRRLHDAFMTTSAAWRATLTKAQASS